jgi:hypothetical protein
VVGNGPSLNTHDISALRNEVAIVANSFYMHEHCATINPQYCCIGDQRFMEDDLNNVKWFSEMEQALPGTTFFIWSAGRRLLRKYGLLQKHKVYYRLPGVPAHRASDVELDLRRPNTVGMSTVSAFSIPLAIYLGFRRIFLVGCDANWLENPKRGGGHFYAENRLFPQYDVGVGSADELELEVQMVHRDLESHRLLRDRVGPRGVEIINATNGGWLDIYPRVRFESLFD